MNIVRIGEDRYIMVDRVTHIEPKRKGRLVVHFAVGGGDIGGPDCCTKLEEGESAAFRQWLDAHSQKA